METHQSGIEIELRASEGVGTIVKVMRRMHLDFLIKHAATRVHLRTRLDGDQTDLELDDDEFLPRFLPCTPGEHELEVAYAGSLGAEPGSSLKLVVEPNEVTIVRFTVQVGKITTLELVGTRPA